MPHYFEFWVGDVCSATDSSEKVVELSSENFLRETKNDHMCHFPKISPTSTAHTSSKTGSLIVFTRTATIHRQMMRHIFVMERI